MSTTVSFEDDIFLRPLIDDPNQPPRTVLFLDHTAKMGGGEIALLNLVAALDKKRCYHPIVNPGRRRPARGEAAGPLASRRTCPPARRLPCWKRAKDSIGPKSLLQIAQAGACIGYAFRLARLARRLRADLIHTNSLKADLYGGPRGQAGPDSGGMARQG